MRIIPVGLWILCLIPVPENESIVTHTTIRNYHKKQLPIPRLASGWNLLAVSFQSSIGM